jgi:WD40 repeat protein
MSSSSSTILWQSPYVNVFKSIRVGEWKKSQKKGDASFKMSNAVRSNVVSVRGQVSASNYVSIPKQRKESLNLHGRFAYIQLRALPPRVWTLHLEVNTTDKQVVRFSFGPTSVFKELHTRGHSVRVPVRLSKKWTTLALDLPGLLSQRDGGPGLKRDNFLSLKSIQICANLDVRNVFTSDEIYRMDNEPKPMSMPVPKASSWNQEYRWTWLPEPPLPPDAENVAAALKRSSSSSPPSSTSSLLGGKKSGERRHFAESSILRNSKLTQASTKDVESEANNALNRASKVLERMGKATSGSRQTTPSRSSPQSSNTSLSSPSSVSFSPPTGSGSKKINSAKSLRGNIGVSEEEMASSRAASLSAASRIMSSVGMEETKEGEIKSETWANTTTNTSVNTSAMDQSMRKTDLDETIEDGQVVEEKDDPPPIPDATSVVAPALGVPSFPAPPTRISTLRPDPIMKLESVIGYSGNRPNNVLWSADASMIVFPSNSIIVLMDNTENKHTENVGGGSECIPRQELLFGHTDDVCALALSPSGTLLGSAQKGKHPMIRLWHLERIGGDGPIKATCFMILTAHASDLQAMHFSSDNRHLCVVGRDQHRRVQLIVWDVTRASVSPGKSVRSSKSGAPDPIVARQISEFPIERIKFSPYHPDRLVSCGRENIRFWRIRNGHLRGCPVILNEYARDTIFTDVAFESTYGPRSIDTDGCVQKRVYVSTSRGTVVQVNYDTRKVECVYRLHDSAIRTIALNEGYCVTGSDDTYLRVWPIDFSDYILEAQHEGPVISVNVSQDGLKLAVGTSNGTVGILDVTTHAYKNLLRSHADTIYSLTIDRERFQFATVSGDRTIRVWSMETLEQLFEFDSSDEQARALAFQPSGSHVSGGTNAPHVLACGFDSGCVRIFQVSTTEMSHEYQQHRGPVLQILFSPDGRHMYSAGDDGHICVYDVHRGYQPVKMVASDTRSERVSMSISPDGNYLASVGPDSRTTIIFQAESLMPVRKIRRTRKIGSLSLGDERKYSNFHTVTFSADSTQLVATTDDGRLVKYDAASGDLLRETPPGLHRSSSSRSSRVVGGGHRGTPLDALQLSPNGKFILTGGEDNLMKVWEYDLHGPSMPAFQSFVGHSHKVLEMHFVQHGDDTRVISIGEGNGIYVWKFHGDAVTVAPKIEETITTTSATTTNSFVATNTNIGGIPMPSFPMEEEVVEPAPTIHSSKGERSPSRSPTRSASAILSDGTAYKAELPVIDGALATLIHTIQRRGRLISTTIAQVSKQLAVHDATRQGTVSMQDFVRTLGRFNFGIHPSSLQVIIQGMTAKGEPNRVDYLMFISELKRISSVAAHDASKFQKLQNESLRRSGFGGTKVVESGLMGDPGKRNGSLSKTSYQRLMEEGSKSSKMESMAKGIGVANSSPPSLELKTILGYGGPGNGDSRNNVLWHPDTGLFGFSCGSIVVLEDLVQGEEENRGGSTNNNNSSTRKQKHLCGPLNDIVMLCGSSDGHLIAAAESVGEDNKSVIWIWDAKGDEIGQIKHSLGSIQAISFGPHGRYLVAVGDYDVNRVVVWNVNDTTLPVASSTVSTAPIHAIDMVELPARDIDGRNSAVQGGSGGGKSGSKKKKKSNSSSSSTTTTVDDGKPILMFMAAGGRTITQWRLFHTTSGEMELVCNRALDTVASKSSKNQEYFTTLSHCNPVENCYRFAVGGGGGSVWLVTGVASEDGEMILCVDTHWSALDAGVDHISWRENGDSTSVVVAGVSHSLQTWKVGPHVSKSSHQPTMLGEYQLDGHVLSLKVDVRARDAIVATDSGTIWYVGNTSGGKTILKTATDTPSPLVRSHTSSIEDISCSADGTLMATAGGIDGTIRIWHLGLLQMALTLDCERCTTLTFLPPIVAPIGSMCGMHPHILAAGDASGTLTYFDLAQVVPAIPGAGSGDRVAARRVRAHTSAVTAMSYVGCTESSQQRILLVSGSTTGEIKVTGPSAGDGTSITLDSPHAGSFVESIDVSPFDPTTWLIASRNSGLSVWRCESSANKTKTNRKSGDTSSKEVEEEDSNVDFACTQLTYVLLRKLVEGSSPFDGASSLGNDSAMVSARDTVASKCPTLAAFSPCESSVVLCTTAAQPFVILFYNYAIKQVTRTINLPKWQWATSLSATVTVDRRAFIAAGLRSGRLTLVDYRTGQTSKFDDDAHLGGTAVDALGFCQPQSMLCAASNNVIHVWSVQPK